jgi:hypothetical protein
MLANEPLWNLNMFLKLINHSEHITPKLTYVSYRKIDVCYFLNKILAVTYYTRLFVC